MDESEEHTNARRFLSYLDERIATKERRRQEQRQRGEPSGSKTAELLEAEIAELYAVRTQFMQLFALPRTEHAPRSATHKCLLNDTRKPLSAC